MLLEAMRGRGYGFLEVRGRDQRERVTNAVVGQWTGEEDIELVVLGEGTFQKQGDGYGGMRGEADEHPGPPPKTIEEKVWISAVEVIKKKKEIGEWKVPRVIG